MTITAGQCRAARAFLDWSREDLAAAAKVAVRTIVDFERGARSPQNSTLAVIAAAFEQAGIEFTNGSEPGVKLRVVAEASAS